jgi:conjugative relaxase-like TrwC/TraI family protein
VVEVLRVAKVRSGGGAYYLDVAAEGSGTGIEAAGEWMGRGTAELDLAGIVRAPDLEAVLSGEDPATGQVLGTGRSQVRVAGFDMTFSAPKSVSLLHALGDPDVTDAVAAGHRSAVGAALSYVERHALAVRRSSLGAPRTIPTTVEGVAAAGFVHRMSRALDPHLHTHVVVANLGRGPEGRWSALDGRGVYAHASATDALYHCHLRHELTRRL